MSKFLAAIWTGIKNVAKVTWKYILIFVGIIATIEVVVNLLRGKKIVPAGPTPQQIVQGNATVVKQVQADIKTVDQNVTQVTQEHQADLSTEAQRDQEAKKYFPDLK